MTEGSKQHWEHYSATLYGAARLIRDHGHARGQFRDEAGGYCLVAALFTAGTTWGRTRVAYGDYENAPPTVWAATERLERVLDAELRKPDGTIHGLADWSDRSDRDRVVEVLRSAARTVRAEARGISVRAGYKAARGTCAECGRSRALRADGLIGAHKRPGPDRTWCAGSHKEPAATEPGDAECPQ